MPPALPVSAVRPEARAQPPRGVVVRESLRGDFVAARFARDAWPAIERVVRAGVPHARGGATGAKTLEERMQEAAVVSVGSGEGVVKDEGDDRAEKASARVRVAAFEFLAAVAADEGAKGALRDVAASAAETALKWALGAAGAAVFFRGGRERTRLPGGGRRRERKGVFRRVGFEDALGGAGRGGRVGSNRPGCGLDDARDRGDRGGQSRDARGAEVGRRGGAGGSGIGG